MKWIHVDDNITHTHSLSVCVCVCVGIMNQIDIYLMYVYVPVSSSHLFKPYFLHLIEIETNWTNKMNERKQPSKQTFIFTHSIILVHISNTNFANVEIHWFFLLMNPKLCLILTPVHQSMRPCDMHSYQRILNANTYQATELVWERLQISGQRRKRAGKSGKKTIHKQKMGRDRASKRER